MTTPLDTAYLQGTASSETRTSNRGDLAFRSFLSLVTKYALPYWKMFVSLMVGSYGAVFLLALLPFIIAAILDVAMGQPIGGEESVGLGNINLSNLGVALFQWLGIESVASPKTAIVIFCGLYLAIGVLYGLATFINYMIALRVRVMAARDMQYDLFQHILGLSMGFFNSHQTGELVSRLDKDTMNVTSSLEEVLTKVLVSPFLIAFYGLLLLRTSTSLFAAAGAAIVLHFALTRGIQNPIRRRVADQFSAFAALAARLYETLLSIRVVKSLGAEEYELSKLKTEIHKVVRTNMRYGVFKHIQEPSRAVINYFLEASIVLLAAFALLSGSLNVTSFILFLYVGRAILRPIGDLATALTGVHKAIGASVRVIQLFEERPAVIDGPHRVSEFRDKIRLEKVFFSYGDATALEDICLQIEKGELVALVGPSGAGKSTLTDLVLRFYDPQQGTITLDGRDLRTLERRSYRRLFGVVPQEPLLFNATVRENINYGREGTTEGDIVDAANIANAHEFIIKLPQGYETIVGDRGIRLSGGERQRIAIARAVIRRPPIMIFDEATSSLDSESERTVQVAIERVLQGSTGIIVAHRLSTVLRADKIVIINDGRIEALGRHADLLQNSLTYQRLLRLQSLDGGEHIKGSLSG